MTFNIQVGGTQQGQPLSQSAAVIEKAAADVAVIQEHGGNARQIARYLHFYCHILNRSVAVLSRFPIAQTLRHGVRIDGVPLPVWIFGAHLKPYPYGPYDLRDNLSFSADDLIRTAWLTRGGQTTELLAEIRPLLRAKAAVFLAGDFNEPSHLDWTRKAADAGRHFGRTVMWPTSRALCQEGLIDSYRTFYSDESRHLGETWTSLPDAREVHDRIDLVYHAGNGIKVIRALIVGEKAATSDWVVAPYPSDHRAVAVTYQFDKYREQ